jgi:hypothetical protein
MVQATILCTSGVKTPTLATLFGTAEQAAEKSCILADSGDDCDFGPTYFVVFRSRVAALAFGNPFAGPPS